MADELNDDIIDLTDDASSGGAGEEQDKPAGAPRPPRPQRPPPAARAESKPASGKKKGGILKIILLIVVALLVAGFVFEEIYFNFLGTRDVFIDLVMGLDPEYVARVDNLDSREAELDRMQSDIEARERMAETREAQLLRRSSELDIREEVVFDWEQWAMPLYRRQMTEQELLDMQSLSISYSRMSPEAAAEILVELEEPGDVAAILYFMSERNAAAILAVMDPVFAAMITEILLYN